MTDLDTSDAQLTQILARLAEQEDRTSRIEAENQRVNDENSRLREEIKELQARAAQDDIPRPRSRSPNERYPTRRELFPNLNDLDTQNYREPNDQLTLNLLEKISTLEAKVNVNRSQFTGMTEAVIQSPFCREILQVTAPERYSAPKVREYKGSSDPYEYVCHFEQKMQTVSIPTEKVEAMKCKTFTQGLSGPALLWFHQLPTGSIRSYSALIQSFIKNFSVNVKISKKPEDLF